MKLNDIILGDCLEAMATIPSESIDLVVTDPPYKLT
jgi:DNA modification methylase